MVRPQLGVTALVFAVLAVVAYWVLQPKSDSEGVAFFSLRRAIPDTLTIAFHDTTVLVSDRRGWKMVRPVEDAADGVAIEALLKRLRFFEVDRAVPYDPSQTSAYGLRPPVCRIMASYRDSSPETLTVGFPNTASPKVYVRRGNEGKVGLVAKHVPETYFMKEAKEWRSPFLLDTHETVITAFGFQVPGEPRVRVEEEGEGKWWVREPYPGKADEGYVGEVLKTFARLEVLEFRDSQSSFSASPITGWVKSAEGDSSWMTLSPSSHADSALARVKDRTATLVVSPKYLSFFAQKADAFRDTRIFPRGLSGVDSLAFLPQGPFLGQEDWSVGERGRHLESVLRAILELRAEEFLEATPERIQALSTTKQELVIIGKEGDLVGMTFGSWGVSQMAFWLDRGPGSRPDEMFLISRSAVDPLLDFIRESGS